MLLGEPIKDTGTDITEPNYANNAKAHFEVRVAGSKAKGSIFFWAEKPEEGGPWDVTRIELQLKDDDKRLLIKKPVENKTEIQSSVSK
jgi:Cytochrome oxidase complex assembly protein 1